MIQLLPSFHKQFTSEFSRFFLPSFCSGFIDRVEDNDDLVPLLNGQTELLKASYGDYYVAELIKAQDDKMKCLVAEVSLPRLMPLTQGMNRKEWRMNFKIKKDLPKIIMQYRKRERAGWPNGLRSCTVEMCRVRNPACTAASALGKERYINGWQEAPLTLCIWRYINEVQ